MKTEDRQFGQSLVMQTKTLLITIVLAFCSFVSNGQTISPKAPTPELEFVMQLNVTLGEAYTVGETQAGKRHVIPITGGTFEGPLLRGTIINGGADYQLVSADGKRTTLEAIYSIKTYDGVNIHVRNEGIVYSGKDASGNDTFYFKAAPRFEAPVDSKYAWLNNAIYVCAPSFGAPGTIILDVWRVK